MSRRLTADERIVAVLANCAVCVGVGHFWLGAPWWATIMWLSLENGLVSLR